MYLHFLPFLYNIYDTLHAHGYLVIRIPTLDSYVTAAFDAAGINSAAPAGGNVVSAYLTRFRDGKNPQPSQPPYLSSKIQNLSYLG